MHSKVWDEITYPFPNFNGAAVEVWGWISDVISHFMISVIHPSTKSPLAGAAWNFSQSQARQLCNAGLSVATSDKRWEI